MELLITGDVSTRNINNFKADCLSEPFVQLIKSSDYVCFNLEGPIVPDDKKTPFQYRSNILWHNILKYGVKLAGKEQPIVTSDESILNLLSLNRNTIVTLANNHIKDGGQQAFEYTLAKLNQSGIKYVGAGLTNTEAVKPLNITDDHGGVVLLNLNWVSSYKYRFPLFLYNATVSDFGAAYLDFKSLKKMVAKLRNNFRHIILILHYGKMITAQNADIGIKYEELLSLNATAVVIHHPHVYVPNPYEKDNIVMVGDFLFRTPNNLPNGERLSSLVKLSIEGIQCNLEIKEFREKDVYAD